MLATCLATDAGSRKEPVKEFLANWITSARERFTAPAVRMKFSVSWPDSAQTEAGPGTKSRAGRGRGQRTEWHDGHLVHRIADIPIATAGAASTSSSRDPPRRPPPDNQLLVVRGGRNSLSDANLERASGDCWERYGFFGMSAFGALGDDLLALSDAVTQIRRRSELRLARCGGLRSAGFEVAATFSNPLHFSVVLPDATPRLSPGCGRAFPSRLPIRDSSQTGESYHGSRGK